MKKSTILVIALVAMIVYAQPPDTLWSRTYGGMYNEAANSVELTPTGGYIFTGMRTIGGYDDYDIWLVATDENGDTLWTKTYGSHPTYDNAECIRKTFDGGYIIAGHTVVGGAGALDVYLIKTDANGNALWTKIYGGFDDDFGLWVQQTPDSGYAVYAKTRSFGPPDTPSIWLLRTDANGDTLWTKAYGIFRASNGQKDMVIPDSGYMLPFRVYIDDQNDFGLLRVDLQGDTLWSKTYGWPSDDYIWACTKTDDGGYIGVGATRSMAPNYDALLVKFAANGDTLWTRTFGGSGSDEAYTVHQVFDGGYILGGWTGSYGAGQFDAWLVRTDADGNMLWQTTWGGLSSDYCTQIQVCADSSYIATGETFSFGNADQAWLLKTGPDVGITEQPTGEPLKVHENLTATIFRGPLQLPEGKKCKVFDITGRVVEPEKVAPGIYFLEIDNKVVQKVVKIR